MYVWVLKARVPGGFVLVLRDWLAYTRVRMISKSWGDY